MGLMDGYGDMQRAGLTFGAGSLGAGLAGMFGGGGGKDPYKDASKFYDQIPGTIKPYYDPYINAGRNALNTTQGEYGKLINDPAGFMQNLGSHYQQSPGFQWQMNQGMNAAGNAAAAGGMAGSPQHQQQAATMAEGLANQDYYNYLNHALNVYGTGLTGMQDINHMGFDASKDLAGGLANNLMNQGNMAFASQAAKNQSQGNMWGNILGGVGALAAFL